MGRATADEQRFLVDLITGNLRQGALDGVVLAAVAKAYAVPDAVVRRATMLAGTAAEVAAPRRRGRGRGARTGRARRRAAGAPDARRVGQDHRGGGRRPSAVATCSSTASSTASGCRCTADPVRSPSTPAASTRSPSGCPRSSRPSPRCPGATSCSTARRSSCSTTADRRRSRSPGPARRARPTSLGLRERVPLTTFLFDVLHRDGVDLIDETGPGAARRPSSTSPRTSWCHGCSPATRCGRLVLRRPGRRRP